MSIMMGLVDKSNLYDTTTHVTILHYSKAFKENAFACCHRTTTQTLAHSSVITTERATACHLSVVMLWRVIRRPIPVTGL